MKINVTYKNRTDSDRETPILFPGLIV